MPERIQGRGAAFNPGNRFEQLRIDDLSDERDEPGPQQVETLYYVDATRSILAKNDSPDVPFTFSVNPYRGCEHGCVYCYARPSHEYLGFSSGLDFESRILVKKNAPQLLEEALRDPAFVPQVIALSGNTDCYQPVERKLKITRGCLEVFLRFRNPAGVITKSAMVARDVDVLRKWRSGTWSASRFPSPRWTLRWPRAWSRAQGHPRSGWKRSESLRTREFPWASTWRRSSPA